MGTASDPALPGYWNDYFADRSKSNRARLTEAYLPLVYRAAKAHSLVSTGYFDRDDLISSGVLGLIDAIDRFDPSNGASFKTYSATRIHGAMLDALRAADWAPRSLRRAARALELARQAGREAGHEPSWAEMAGTMNLSNPDFTRLVSQLDNTHILSLDVASVNDTAQATDALLAEELDPSQLAVALEDNVTLHREISHLTDREQNVLHDYYWDGDTLATIGAGLRVTESRVSQIRTGAQRILKAQLTVAWKVV